MKIGFTVDTNMLLGSDSKRTGFVKNIDYFLDYIKALKKKDKNNELIFFVSEIVAKEILNHKRDKMEEEYQSLKSKFNKCDYFLDGIIPKEKIDSIIKEEEKKISKLNILKAPKDSETFEKIVESALERKSPFVKNRGDKGFKDAIIWESILKSEYIKSLDMFYFFTCDCDFDSKTLEEEFNSVNKSCKLKIINIVNNNEKRQKALSIIINENNLIETNITKLFSEDIILKFIKNLKSEYISVKYGYNYNVNLSINYNEFDNDDFDIDDVVLEDGVYKVYISINTFKYSKNILLPLSASLLLYIREDSEEYIYDSYKLEKIEFVTTSMDKINERLNNFSKIVSDSVSKDVQRLKDEIERARLNDIVYAASLELNKYREPLSKLVKEAKRLTESSEYQVLSKQINEINNYFKNIPKVNDIEIVDKATEKKIY